MVFIHVPVDQTIEVLMLYKMTEMSATHKIACTY